MSEFRIGDRPVGDNHSPLMVAELSANHRGRYEEALRVIDAVKKAGVDAVKLQTYTADSLTIDSGHSDFVIQRGPWAGQRLYNLYEEAQTPWEWHQGLFDHAANLGLICFSTPFDATAVEFLESLGAPAYKIASFEIIDLELIKTVAATGKPIILSTGMANNQEIDDAVTAARSEGASDIALLHCISAYPSPVDESNLETIRALEQNYGCVVGISDHTMDSAVAIASVALGARIVEKHVTLSREAGGPDASFSLEPNELEELCQECRAAWSAVGSVYFGVTKSERDSRVFRRSLYVVADVRAGEALTPEHVRSIRPGYGLAPKYLPQVIGRRATRDLIRGERFSWDMVDGPSC